MTVRFDDLDDLGNASATTPAGVNVPRDITEVKQAVHIEKCPRCGGTGKWHGYSLHGRTCFKCGGTGKLQFKASKAQREKNRASAQARKANIQAANLAAFEKANPEIAAWWNSTDFPFAVAMKNAVTKYGDLTERRLEHMDRRQ